MDGSADWLRKKMAPLACPVGLFAFYGCCGGVVCGGAVVATRVPYCNVGGSFGITNVALAAINLVSAAVLGPV